MSVKVKNCLSGDGSGFVTTTFGDDYAFRGNGFTINNHITMAGSQTLNFLIDMSNVDSQKTVFSLPIFVASGSNKVVVKVYEGADYSGGTPITAFNINRNSETALQTVITAGASDDVGGKGTQFRTHVAFASNKVSEQSTGLSFIVLNKAQKYLIELVNSEATTTDVEYDSILYEA